MELSSGSSWRNGSIGTDGVGIGHSSPVEECEPVVEIEDRSDGSIVKGTPGSVA